MHSGPDCDSGAADGQGDDSKIRWTALAGLTNQKVSIVGELDRAGPASGGRRRKLVESDFRRRTWSRR